MASRTFGGGNGALSASERAARELSSNSRRSSGYNGARQGANGGDRFQQDRMDRARDAAVADDVLDAKFGFPQLVSGESRLGWLLSMRPSVMTDPETNAQRACLDCFFIGSPEPGTETAPGATGFEVGSHSFKARLPHEPYIYLGLSDAGFYHDVESWLQRKFEKYVSSVMQVAKQDLDLKNHLSGLTRAFVKVSFPTVQALLHVRQELQTIVNRNKERAALSSVYGDSKKSTASGSSSANGHDVSNYDLSSRAIASAAGTQAFLESMNELREYDVPYSMRVSIDTEVRCGNWFQVTVTDPMHVHFDARTDIVQRADPVVLAYDIETTHAPLKFPDFSHDTVMMISYMIDGVGYLIVNRTEVSADIDSFEYTPKPEYVGIFEVFNVPDERSLLVKFFEHIQQVKPHVYVTYNGDFFDWPFVAARAAVHGLDMYHEIGVKGLKYLSPPPEARGDPTAVIPKDSEWTCRFGAHLDAFKWVQRDSYLPQGSQGLKAVTKQKLGYDPKELSPAEMSEFAIEQPQTLAEYSVSDAVATYYLYMKYVHPFIFSLCTILPLPPDDVLRKGTGTLCEALLMVEAFRVNVICPNKHTDSTFQHWRGHLLESETYSGGFVEALQSGVYRSDIAMKFSLNPAAFQSLITHLDGILAFAATVEGKIAVEDIENYDEVKADIRQQLEELRDHPKRKEEPNIYHLDVAAMYPNIILTNRLQPSAMVDDETCAACVFSSEDNNCKRRMNWIWRGDYVPATKLEELQIRQSLETERFENPRTVRPFGEVERKRRFGEAAEPDQPKQVGFFELDKAEQERLVRARLKDYSKRTYKVQHREMEEERVATVCQREHPFYVDMVRSFRDRRYVYKDKQKEAYLELLRLKKSGGSAAQQREQDKLIVLWESMQLAHKCILNSFYGYVMRKGARWYSMEMAGTVTHTGANIIKEANEFLSQVGIPLELDTDGVWCCLPASFPENFTFKSKTKNFTFSFPGVVLNNNTHVRFHNDQYQTLVESPDSGEPVYKTTDECTIFFEVDGPYRAMILPSSRERGRKLKKRYAVFNHNGTLAELKGFEIKRRGELQLIKNFQSELFEKFLEGTDLIEAYQMVAEVANNWLDVLDSRGRSVEEEEILQILSESTNMSKKLTDYGGQKSRAITAVRRLMDMLDDPTLGDSGGVSVTYVVSAKPSGDPVTTRVIPIQIFQSEDYDVRLRFLRQWTRQPMLESADVRDILDWSYYAERLSFQIQKLITIPAALQGVPNPVPRVKHPEWLVRDLDLTSLGRQQRMTDMFQHAVPSESTDVDMEDLMAATATSLRQPMSNAATSSRSDQIPAIVEAVVDEQFTDIEDFAEDPYMVWLIRQKAKWRHLLAERKRKRLLRGPSRSLTSSSAIFSYIKQQQELLASGTWHILQIASAAEPGVFAIWVLVEAHADLPVTMQRVYVEVPRTFYVSFFKDTPQVDEFNSLDIATDVTSTRRLPHHKAAARLFRFDVPEVAYRKTQKQLHTRFVDDDNIEGTYESHVPLLFRALVHIGSVSKLVAATPARKHSVPNGRSKSKAKRSAVSSAFAAKPRKTYGNGALFSLNELAASVKSLLSRDSSVYLHDSLRAKLHMIFFYHAYDSNSQSGAIGIVFNRSAGHNEAASSHVIICNPFSQDLAGARRAVSDYSRSREDAIPSPTMLHARTLADGYARANEILQQIRERQHGPLVVLYQCTKPHTQLGVPSLREFPVVEQPPFDSDTAVFRRSDTPTNTTAHGNGTGLGAAWQEPLVETFFRRYHSAVPRFHDQVILARYGGVPVGNLATLGGGGVEWDVPVNIFDVLYARRLQQQNQVWWMSEGYRPDLGGSEVDDFSFANSFDAVLQPPEVTEPGCYTSLTLARAKASKPAEPNAALEQAQKLEHNGVCVELRIENMPVNATLMADRVNEVEGDGAALLAAAAAISSGDNGFVSFDDTHTALRAFGTMRELLGDFVSDVALEMGEADATSSFVAAPLCPPDELLMHFWRWVGNPASRFYDPSMHKLVFDHMKKVFLQLLAELRRLGATVVHATFRRIIICTHKPTEKDAQDYVALVLRRVREQEVFRWVQIAEDKYWTSLLFWDSSNFLGVFHDPDTASQLIDQQWAMMSMHKPVQQLFSITMSDYILKWSDPVNSLPRNVGKARVSRSTPAETIAARVELLETYFTPRLLNVVTSIQSSGLSGTRQASLDFVKSVCMLMKLDKNSRLEVDRVRRQLLKKIGVGEFADEAQWFDPLPPFVLADVICTFCTTPVDLDLLRNERLKKTVSTQGKGKRHAKGSNWKCHECGHAYPMMVIEARLVELLQQASMAFQLQDVVCSKCGDVKASRVADSICAKCSGQYLPRETRATFMNRLSLFRRLSDMHGLEWLGETVDRLSL